MAGTRCSARNDVCAVQPGKLKNQPARWSTKPAPAQGESPAAKTILRLGNGQAKIIRSFPTPVGWTGFVVQVGEVSTHDVLIYVTKNGKYFFLGGLFRADGTNLSREFAQRYLPKADLAPRARPANPASYEASLEKTTWFAVGNPKAKKTLWMVMDPNCIFCHLTWEKLLPAIHSGTLLLHVVMVGFLKASSPGKAAAILMAKNPAAALRYDEAHFQEAREEGGIRVPKHIPANIAAEVSANTAWMDGNGVEGTPFLLWNGPRGHVHAEDGMPEESMKEFLGGIGG